MNKKNKSKNNKLYKVFKVLDYLGIILLVIEFVFLILDIIPVKYYFLLMFFSTLFLLPDSIMFVIEEYKSDAPWGCYYSTKLFGLIFVLIVSSILFFKLE